MQISGHKDEISRLPFKVHINYTALNKDPVLMLNDKKLNKRDDQVVSITVRVKIHFDTNANLGSGVDG